VVVWEETWANSRTTIVIVEPETCNLGRVRIKGDMIAVFLHIYLCIVVIVVFFVVMN
jgi:hypothetical protein